MDGSSDWVPAGVDTGRANVARVYDYWLGGNHNFLEDARVGAMLAAIEPNVRGMARESRRFLGRAVRYLSKSGIRQFLDIGSGIPTEGNVHEIAQEADPEARVAYVDIDPVAIAHSRAILAANPNAAIAEADLRDPEKILAHPAVSTLIDFTEPVGLLLVAVLHFFRDDEDPWQTVATLRDALAPGSYLVIAHGSDEGKDAAAREAEETYTRTVVDAPFRLRSRKSIERFLDGLEIVEPGVTWTPEWRPASPADVPANPWDYGSLAGVARKM